MAEIALAALKYGAATLLQASYRLHHRIISPGDVHFQEPGTICPFCHSAYRSPHTSTSMMRGDRIGPRLIPDANGAKQCPSACKGLQPTGSAVG
jgi:hypothetical protein